MGVAAATIVGTVRAQRWRAFDLQLLLVTLLLIGFGLLMSYSVSFGADRPAAASQTLRTALWAAIGLIGFFVAASVDYHWLKAFAAPIYVAVLGLLLLTSLLGQTVNGATMSVSLGLLDLQFSEICKVLMIAVLAAYLAARRERIGRLSTIGGALLLMGIPTLLVLRQPDLGTALVFVAIGVGMLFMAGAALSWMALLAGGVVAVSPLVIGSLADYQRDRLFCFINPSTDPQGACYQLVQALNAVGSGGWLGQGLTAGRQNQLGYLPVQSTDFIFTVVAEELGLIGGLLLLGLFALLLWRVLAIGWSSRDALGGMLAAGMASLLVFQIGLNVGMVVGLLPVTGVPLPFITYGGSSLVSLMVGLGILESVRMHARKPAL